MSQILPYRGANSVGLFPPGMVAGLEKPRFSALTVPAELRETVAN
jgi:hypothetical protein